jgi:hypothetical protein
LQFDRKLAELVQKQRPAVGLRERTLLSFRGAGERAFFVAEEQALREALRDRRAVDDDEGTVLALTGEVNAARDDLLPRARLSENEDRERRLRDTLEHAEDPTHFRRRTDELAETVSVPDIDPLLPRGLDRDAALPDENLRLRRDDPLANAKRADERPVRTAEVAHQDAFIDGAQLAMNRADLGIADLDPRTVVTTDDERIDADGDLGSIWRPSRAAADEPVEDPRPGRTLRHPFLFAHVRSSGKNLGFSWEQTGGSRPGGRRDVQARRSDHIDGTSEKRADAISSTARRMLTSKAMAGAQRSCVTVAVSLLVATTVTGCRDRTTDKNAGPEIDDLSFAEEGADTSAAESDAQLLTSSLVSASTSGIGLASVDLSDSDLGTRDIGDGAKAIYFPRSCLEVTQDTAAQTATYKFDNCMGPNGLRGVKGQVSAHYTINPEHLHLEITADNLTINDATVDWAATADITAVGADRSMTWKAQLLGVTAGKRSFSRNNEHTVAWRLGEPCLEVSGFSSGAIQKRDQAEGEGREIRTDISDFKRCRGGCPEAGGKISVTNVSKNKVIELRYDGTNRATFVAPNGKESSVPLLCR